MVLLNRLYSTVGSQGVGAGEAGAARLWAEGQSGEGSELDFGALKSPKQLIILCVSCSATPPFTLRPSVPSSLSPFFPLLPSSFLSSSLSFPSISPFLFCLSQSLLSTCNVSDTFHHRDCSREQHGWKVSVPGELAFWWEQEDFFTGGPAAETPPCNAGAAGPIPDGELWSHTPARVSAPQWKIATKNPSATTKNSRIHTWEDNTGISLVVQRLTHLHFHFGGGGVEVPFLVRKLRSWKPRGKVKKKIAIPIPAPTYHKGQLGKTNELPI